MDFSKRGVVKKQHQIKSMSKRLTTKFRIAVFRLSLVGIVFVAITGCFLLAGSVKGMIDNAPSISQVNIDPEGYTSYIYYRDGTLSQSLIGQEANRVYVEIEDIPLHVIQCFIAKEDERFYEHNGIDVRGIFRAAASVLETRDLGFGGSTITQQLLKNKVFSGGSEKNNYDKIVRKIQEQYLAIQLENVFTKDQILEAYINYVNLGNASFGIQVAANNYFGKDASDLTLSEAAVIAPIVWSPTLLNPVKYPEDNAERRLATLDKMLEHGYCTKEEYDVALADNVYDRIMNYNASKAVDSSFSYYNDTVFNQVLEDLQEKLGYTATQAYDLLYRGGIKIYTAQDPEIQAIMDKYYTDEENFPELGKGSYYELSTNYAISVTEEDGTETHYHYNDLIEYFSDFADTQGLYYHSDGRKKGISQYTIDKEDLEEKVDEFKAYVTSDGEKKYIGGKTVFTLQPQSSMVIMDQHTGEVVAIYGGRGDKKESLSFNRASGSVRQVGSTFKVLASFLPALDTAGMTLATTADDSKYHYPDTETYVRNWNGEVYKGLKSIREGIYNSMNIVACRIFERVTPQVGFSYLKKLGFSSLVENMTTEEGKVYSDIVYPLVLGGLTYGVTNVELTAAYATIANSGLYNKPIFYTKVVDQNGKVLLSNENIATPVIKSTTAYLLTNAMEDTIKKGTGSTLKFQRIDMSLAGKTGTSTANNDLWFVGYSPYYTAGIWTGFDNNFDQDANKTYHRNLWRNIMEEVHEVKNLKNIAFERPDNIVSATVCAKCGNLAVPGLCDQALSTDTASKTTTELFAKGTVPTQKCTCHVEVLRCKASNMLAGPNCPAADTVKVVYLIKEETSPTWDTPSILPTGEDAICPVHSSGDNTGIDLEHGNSGEDNLPGNNLTPTGGTPDATPDAFVPTVTEAPTKAPDEETPTAAPTSTTAPTPTTAPVVEEPEPDIETEE